MAGKKFKDLDLKNAFLFVAALQDEETCRLVLEMILGCEIPKVKVHVEHSLVFSSEFRSVRLDVYASDEMEVTYNLEMENWDKKELPKRSRYHQAEMDVAGLQPGAGFMDLKPTYVIFICTFDPFGKGLYRYTFENKCREREFVLGDEAYRIFFNTKGTNKAEVPKLLVDFLHYVEDSSDVWIEEAADQRIGRLHEKICSLKKSREWEARYMTLEKFLENSKEESRQEGWQEGLKEGRQEGLKEGRQEGLKEGRQEGLREGHQEGRQKILKLISFMAQGQEAAEISRLTYDEAFLEEMMRKYHLN